MVQMVSEPESRFKFQKCVVLKTLFFFLLTGKGSGGGLASMERRDTYLVTCLECGRESKSQVEMGLSDNPVFDSTVIHCPSSSRIKG